MPAFRITRLFVCLLAAVCSAAQPPLLQGVEHIPAFGTPGLLAVWGPDAFVIAAAKDDAVLAPLIAAGPLGRGRVVCFTHTGYVSKGDDARANTLLRNCVRWAAADVPKPAVGLIVADCEPALRDSCAVTKLGKGWETQLGGLDAVVVRGWDFTEAQVAALTAFVRGGGGMVAGQTAWAWNAPADQTLRDNPLNRVVAAAGIAWTGGYADKTAPDGFAADAGPATLNAYAALKLITEATADAEALRQASASVVAAARALPPEDAILRPRLAALLATHESELAPSEQAPIRAGAPMARLLLAYQVQELELLPAASVKAHPGAAAFPGSVPEDAPRADRTVCVNGGLERWQSTGLYAPPGEVVTVTVPDELAAKGLRIRIGCHKDHLWHHRDWKRVPDITLERAITRPSTEVASAFGGPIYFIAPKGESAGALCVRVKGAVEAPLFVLGATDPETWKQTIRAAPGPWAELATSRVILSVPSSSIRDLDDPTSLLEFWDRIMDAQAELAAIPRERPNPERYVADVQISAGYMHSGYPIMTHLDAVADMTSLANMQKGTWGLLHEMGHNHQKGDWTFGGTGEVTCNLFAMYCIEKVCGLPWAQGHDGLKSREKKIGVYKAKGRKFEDWKKDPFLALAMYAQLVEGFGWEPFITVFGEYRDLDKNQRPQTDDEKRDQWMVRFSRTIGKNLGPFFDDWGVPVSDAAKAGIAELPEWMPAEPR